MSSDSASRAMHARLCGLGVFLLVLGLAAYGGVQLAIARVNDTARWPSVSGRVVASEVSTAVVKTGPVRRFTPVANIRYTYSVEGQRYECEGGRVVPMLHFRPEGTPEELVARYPVGSSVTVFYNPADPADALLTPEPADDARRFIRSLTVLGPFVGFLGLLMVAIGAMHLRAGSRAEAPVHDQACHAAPAAPRPSRAMHWLLRLAATLFGLFLLLLASLLAVTPTSKSSVPISATAEVISLVLFLGAAAFGGLLVRVGMRRPSRGSAAVG